MTSRRAVTVVLAAFVLAGCGSGATSERPTTSSLAPRPSVPPSDTGTARPATSQTDTAWGRIWDTLPSTFPTVSGSTPGEETAAGPASADLVIEGMDAKAVATVLETQLKQAGYATAGLSGPLENGGYVLDMTGPAAACKLQVNATPMGGLTTITILYGADCPHD